MCALKTWNEAERKKKKKDVQNNYVQLVLRKRGGGVAYKKRTMYSRRQREKKSNKYGYSQCGLKKLKSDDFACTARQDEKGGEVG